MIVGLLPYLLWKFVGETDMQKWSIISQWFKPAVQQQAEDAYCNPQEECIKNTRDLMLTLAFAAADALYWEQEDLVPKPPKQQKVQINKESLNNSVLLTIKMAVSTRKPSKSVLKMLLSPPTPLQKANSLLPPIRWPPKAPLFPSSRSKCQRFSNLTKPCLIALTNWPPKW